MLTSHRLSFREALSTAEWGGRATRAEVDLDAIAWNTGRLKQLVQPAELMPVVKANGYGHGAVAVAKTVVAAGAERLAVYTVAEGVELRQSGVTAPILVFGPFEPAEVEGIVEFDLTPTILNLKAAMRLSEYLSSRRSAPLGVHLKVDTGLSRSGVKPEEAVELARAIGKLPALELAGLYTHFASGDEPDSGLTERQLERFQGLIQDLEHEGVTITLKHAAATAAAIKFPNSRLGTVRAGMGIYGYYPGDTPRDVALQPALSLLSSVIRIVELEPGEGVGYGHEFVASRLSRVGLVPIGYGDGLPRELGRGRGTVLVRGKPAPIVGRVSMDQISLDVTDIPEVEVGDRATLIGRDGASEQTADDLAMAAGTISYDILCRLLPRVPRLYRRGDQLSLD